jgi:hypothetical protein
LSKSSPARLLKNKWGFLVPHAHIWQFESISLKVFVARASCGVLELIWIRTSTLLEYTDAGVWWKTLVKTVALRSAAAFSYGYEISATLKKVENSSPANG